MDQGNYTPTTTQTWRLHESCDSNIPWRTLCQNLTRWINGHTFSDNLVVRDLTTDLSDGMILAHFLAKVTGAMIPFTAGASERTRRANVTAVARFLDQKYGIQPSSESWTVDGILSNDIVSMMRLLVILSRILSCPYTVPANVQVAVVHTETLSGAQKTKTQVYRITEEDEVAAAERARLATLSRQEQPVSPAATTATSTEMLTLENKPPAITNKNKDAFDLLFDSAPEKVDQVVQSLKQFVNTQLNETGYAVVDLQRDMNDGVYLIVLIGSLAKFYVPVYQFSLNPRTHEAKVKNIRVAFELMATLGMDLSRIQEQDVIQGDLKAVLRVIYTLYQAFPAERSVTA